MFDVDLNATRKIQMKYLNITLLEFEVTSKTLLNLHMESFHSLFTKASNKLKLFKQRHLQNFNKKTKISNTSASNSTVIKSQIQLLTLRKRLEIWLKFLVFLLTSSGKFLKLILRHHIFIVPFMIRCSKEYYDF